MRNPAAARTIVVRVGKERFPVVPFIVGTLAGLAIAGSAAVFAKRMLLEAAREETGGYF